MSVSVVITGASGLLGRAIMKEFKQNAAAWLTKGLAWSRAKDDLIKVDITCHSSVHEVIERIKPTFVVHCAAERRQDVVEKDVERTRELNIGATQILCQEAAAVDATVLYIGSNYIFDGTSPPYSECDGANPLNVYGQSKLEGEKIVLSSNSKNIVLRLPLLYGPVEFLSECSVTSLFSDIKSSDVACRIDNVRPRFPTHCGDVAVVVRELLEQYIQNVAAGGVYHWSSNECMTKHEMAVAMGTTFGLSTSHLHPDNTEPSADSKKPRNVYLISGKLEAMGIGQRTAFGTGIAECLKPFL